MLRLFSSNKSNNFYFANKSHQEIQSVLANYNLCSFTHRIFIRLDLFLFKIINSKKPPILNEKLKINQNDTLVNRLKSNKSGNLLFNGIYVPYFVNGFGLKTFDHFGALFYNNFLTNLPYVNLKYFKKNLAINLGIYVELFLEKFEKFNNLFKYKRYF